jgi:hypothetical protein
MHWTILTRCDRNCRPQSIRLVGMSIAEETWDRPPKPIPHVVYIFERCRTDKGIQDDARTAIATCFSRRSSKRLPDLGADMRGRRCRALDNRGARPEPAARVLEALTRNFVFTVPGLYQIKQAGFGSINLAKGFRLLQAEASHLEVTTRGPHLAQHMVDCLRNIVLFSCPHVYSSSLSGFRKSSRRSNWR